MDAIKINPRVHVAVTDRELDSPDSEPSVTHLHFDSHDEYLAWRKCKGEWPWMSVSISSDGPGGS